MNFLFDRPSGFEQASKEVQEHVKDLERAILIAVILIGVILMFWRA